MKLEKNIFPPSIGIKFGSVCKIGFVAYEFKSYWFSLSFIYKLKFIENWYNILISSYPDTGKALRWWSLNGVVYSPVVNKTVIWRW